MDLIEALKTRRSIRKFKAEPVPEELLNELLDLANAAPSAGNLQARAFIVARNEKVKKQLSTAALGQGFVRDAPVVIVVCGNVERTAAGYGSRGRDLYSIQDADAAVMHILLATHAMCLGACWVGAFNDDEVSSILELPQQLKPIAIIPLGYPDETPAPTSRITIEELLHVDKWKS